MYATIERMADDYDGAGDDLGDVVEELDEVLDDTVEAGEKIEDDGKRELAKENRALQFLMTHHPECRLPYREEILQVLPLESYPPSNLTGNHKSVPYLTIFEKTKIIGFRANQLAHDARPLIDPVPPHITDVLDIARLELEQKRLPFILKRPMPDGTYEYWRLSDLMII
jgi:DNA-directed RNA polymerase I, II, and III subunit RPABC2